MWNEKYSRDDYFYGTQPCEWLRMNRYRLPTSGKALAIADGEGRNGVFLAECGLQTTSLDQSSIGQQKAATLANQRGVHLNMIQADLAEFAWETESFDVIAAIYAHLPQPLRAKTHAACAAALRPGGLFVLEAFHPNQLDYQSGGPKVTDLLYSAVDIMNELPGLKMIDAFEGLTLLSEGPGHSGPGFVTRILARAT